MPAIIAPIRIDFQTESGLIELLFNSIVLSNSCGYRITNKRNCLMNYGLSLRLTARQ